MNQERRVFKIFNDEEVWIGNPVVPIQENRFNKIALFSGEDGLSVKAELLRETSAIDEKGEETTTTEDRVEIDLTQTTIFTRHDPERITPADTEKDIEESYQCGDNKVLKEEVDPRNTQPYEKSSRTSNGGKLYNFANDKINSGFSVAPENSALESIWTNGFEEGSDRCTYQRAWILRNEGFQQVTVEDSRDPALDQTHDLQNVQGLISNPTRGTFYVLPKNIEDPLLEKNLQTTKFQIT